MRRSRPMQLLLLGLVVVLVLAGLGVACASTPKEKIEAELLALPKNAGLRSSGLERVTLPVDPVAFGIEEATFVYARIGPFDAEAPARPPLVLVHGTPGSLFGWSEAVFGLQAREPEVRFRGLAQDREVWLLDVVGHGVTPHVPGTMTFQRGADWIGAFLRGMELDEVTVVGHSYGGEFAWRAALDHPERITRLVLVDAAGIPRRDDEWLSEEVAMRELWLAPYGYVLNSEARVGPALQLHFHEPIAPERLTEMKRVLDNAANWRATVELARDENGTRVEDLARVGQPTLLLWGADDHAYPPARFAEEFERRIPGATLVTLEGLGHYPHEEGPRAFNEALRAWLDAE